MFVLKTFEEVLSHLYLNDKQYIQDDGESNLGKSVT